MTDKEKEQFCRWAASVFAPPDEQLAGAICREAVSSQGEDFGRSEAGGAFLGLSAHTAQSPEDLLRLLKREYERLFTDRQGEKISLVESTYKPWTQDPDCGLAFAGATGLLRGDSALHMEDLFQRLSLEVPEEFRSTPDHLALELEFLSLLYGWGHKEYGRMFVEDHLDWIGDLKDRVAQANPHPFYRQAIEMIHLFLLSEKENGKEPNHGSKNLH